MGQGVIIEDDEPQKPRKRLELPVLESWSRAELDAYIAELRAEIARAEGEIARKQNFRAAADAFFRRPGGNEA